MDKQEKLHRKSLKREYKKQRNQIRQFSNTDILHLLMVVLSIISALFVVFKNVTEL